MTEIRCGSGWDIHRLEPGRPLILGGVRIPCELGLAGHSDADVLAHAVIDAMLGAAGLGDIGMHFPDTDARWAGADSMQLMRRALDLVRSHGYELVNVDATVILERPKLGPFREAIRQRLAEVLGIESERVSVKFKTAEGMGPVGEGRAAEAQALVTLRRSA